MPVSSLNTFDFDSAIKWHLDQVRKLRSSTGLFTASASDVTTGYNKAWLRDIYFMTLGFKFTKDMDTVCETAKALLKILEKHQEKISWATHNKPPYQTWQYIHARYHTETFYEYWEDPMSIVVFYGTLGLTGFCLIFFLGPYLTKRFP